MRDWISYPDGNYSACPAGDERRASEDMLDGRQHVVALLAHGGDVAAPNATEGRRSVAATEAAGDLLLHLHHPQVPLGQVVVERHPEILHEGQHRLLMSCLLYTSDGCR